MRRLLEVPYGKDEIVASHQGVIPYPVAGTRPKIAQRFAGKKQSSSKSSRGRQRTLTPDDFG